MNYNFELTEIMYLASQALISNDDTVMRLAIGDIYHTAKSAIRGASAATEEELHEAATEEPVTVGCPSLVPPRVIAHDEPAAEVPRTEEEKQRQREIEHFSFCNGLFPIHTVRTPSGSMGKCEINGRKFSFASLDSTGPNETPSCTVDVRDGDKKIALMTVLRGRSIAGPMAMGALKAYVKRLSGSNKFHRRGGFLKQAVARAKEKGEAK